MICKSFWISSCRIWIFIQKDLTPLHQEENFRSFELRTGRNCPVNDTVESPIIDETIF